MMGYWVWPITLNVIMTFVKLHSFFHHEHYKDTCHNVIGLPALNVYIVQGPKVDMIVRAVLIGKGNLTLIHFNILLVEH